jgi:hypothetical protein
VIVIALRHGTAYHYNLGCRCERCREAARVKRRQIRDRARAENRPSYQHELAVSRRLKERYRGTCIECGAPTTGCDGPSSARALCLVCSNRRITKALRGTGPLQAKVLAAIESGARFSEIAAQVGSSKNAVAPTINRLLRYGLIERVSRGRYRVIE